MSEDLLTPRLVTLCDRMGNHRTARTFCALAADSRLILCAPKSLLRFSQHITLECGEKRLYGTLRPLPAEDKSALHARFEAAFPQTARSMARPSGLELMLFVPDAP